MPERFDALITAAINGDEQFHEVKPSDFGAFGGQRTMFMRCLEVLVRRYPRVRMIITGGRNALMDMGLMPNGEILVEGQLLRTWTGPTAEPARRHDLRCLSAPCGRWGFLQRGSASARQGDPTGVPSV